MTVGHIDIPPIAKLITVYLALALELTGFAVHLWMIRREMFDFSPSRTFAEQLDFDFPNYNSLMRYLISQPTDLLKLHANMSRYRRERMGMKAPFLYGSAQLLGILPFTLAVAYQVKVTLANRNIGIIDGVIVFVIFTLYVASWTSVVTKFKLDAMDMLLQEAVRLQMEEVATNASEDSLPKFGHSPQTPVAPLR
ncbi:MAG: hypothetical protein GAK28_01323 [Luteibacter sp.]|nr:MAG: hypothetical protein GAK28_01323 [Luteibacter sp.]